MSSLSSTLSIAYPPDDSSFTWEKYLQSGSDLNRFFFTRGRSLPSGNVIPIDFNKYWFVTSASSFAGSLTVPSATLSYISSYSRRALKYGQSTMTTQLPDFSIGDEGSLRALRWGFENGSNAGNLQIMWNYNRSASNVDALYCTIQTPWSKSGANVDCIAVNANYKTAVHNYTIKLGKGIAYWFIDDILVNISHFIPNKSYNTGTVTKPLQQANVQTIPTVMPEEMQSLLELQLPASPTTDQTLAISPYSYRLAPGNGELSMFRKVRVLLSANTIAGTSIASGSQTSESLPGYGYTRKTLYFVGGANGGNLQVMYLDDGGTYRQYSTTVIPAASAAVAPIVIPDDVNVFELIYTPSAFPETPAVCELYMR